MSLIEAGSATEPEPQRKLTNFDRMLLVVLSVLLISHAGLYYICLHFNFSWMFVANWMVAILVGKDTVRAGIDRTTRRSCCTLCFQRASYRRNHQQQPCLFPAANRVD